MLARVDTLRRELAEVLQRWLNPAGRLERQPVYVRTNRPYPGRRSR